MGKSLFYFILFYFIYLKRKSRISRHWDGTRGPKDKVWVKNWIPQRPNLIMCNIKEIKRIMYVYIYIYIYKI